MFVRIYDSMQFMRTFFLFWNQHRIYMCAKSGTSKNPTDFFDYMLLFLFGEQKTLYEYADFVWNSFEMFMQRRLFMLVWKFCLRITCVSTAYTYRNINNMLLMLILFKISAILVLLCIDAMKLVPSSIPLWICAKANMV